MTFEFETVSIRKFLIVALTGGLISIFGSISLGLILDNLTVFVVLFLALFAGTIYFSHKIASAVSNISINENSFQLNDTEVSFDSISGYFLNETGLTMSALDLKLKSNSVVSIRAVTFGERGKRYRQIVAQLLNAIKSKSNSVEKLEYQDIYPRQIKFLKGSMYLLIPLSIIFDLFFLFLLFSDNKLPPWQLLLMNSSLLSLVPYLKRKNNTLS